MARVESLSCCTTAPLSEMPANRPFEREYVRISLSAFQSVPAEACRPTGPAEAEASPPTWNLFESMRCMPCSFITTMTRSMPSTPICNPQLPPPTEMNAGALQPEAVRQVATPRPCLPPNTNPALSMRGTTAMHFAFSITSCGMPLSGAAMIWSSAVPAFVRRSRASCFPFAQDNVPRDITTISNNSFFIETASKRLCVLRFAAARAAGVVFLAGSRSCRSRCVAGSDPAQQQQDDHDHEHQPEPAAGEVSPVAAVVPPWQSSAKHEY